jgi:hypothetical protein
LKNDNPRRVIEPPLRGIIKPAYLLTFGISLLCTLAAFAIVPRGTARKPDLPSGTGTKKAYIVCSVKNNIDDKNVLSALENAGFKGIIACANQTVYLQSFSSLEQISPAEFLERVTEFDPRNDGFAGKVYNFFISDGESRFYIPLSEFGIMPRPESIENRIRQALRQAAPGGIKPASISYPAMRTAGAVNILPMLPFIAAWLLTLFLYLRRTLTAAAAQKNIPRLFPLLVMLPCYRLGAAGCLIAAALFALRPYLATAGIGGLFFGKTNEKKHGAMRGKSWARRYGQAALSVCFVLAVSITGAIALDAAEFAAANYFFPLALIALFTLADLAALFLGTARIARVNSKFIVRPRFSPVPLRSGASRPRIAPSAVIFLIAGIVSIPLAKLPHFSLGNSNEGMTETVLPFKNTAKTEGLSYKDYEAHYRFQQNFAFTRLNGNNEKGGYLHYIAGQDGLMVPEADASIPDSNEAPPASYTLPAVLR